MFTAPTAELPAAGGVMVDGSIDRYGKLGLVAGYGLGGIGEVELTVLDSDARSCSPCEPTYRATAAFRIGAPVDAWFVGQPALAFGVHTTIGARDGNLATDAYVIASRRIGFANLHAGADVIATSEGGVAAPVIVRPLGGLELHPPKLPKTTLLADVSWQPRFEAAAATSELAFSWGVRYQTFKWAAVELGVRHDASSFGEPDVFAGIRGQWP